MRRSLRRGRRKRTISQSELNLMNFKLIFYYSKSNKSKEKDDKFYDNKSEKSDDSRDDKKKKSAKLESPEKSGKKNVSNSPLASPKK